MFVRLTCKYLLKVNYSSAATGVPPSLARHEPAVGTEQTACLFWREFCIDKKKKKKVCHLKHPG